MAETARQKVARLSAKVAELQVEIAAASVLAENEVDTGSIEAGYVITAKYGRGDKAEVVTATVIGVKREAGKAALIKVQIGEGFDATTGIIFEAAVQSIVSKPGQEPEVAADPLAQDEQPQG